MAKSLYLYLIVEINFSIKALNDEGFNEASANKKYT